MGISATLSKRILSGLVLSIVSFFFVLAGGWVFLAYLSLWGAVALYECVHLALRTKERAILLPAGVLYVGFTFFCCYLIRESFPMIYAVFFVTMVAFSDMGAYAFGKIIGGPKMASKISPNKTWAGFIGALSCPGLAGIGFAVYRLGFSGVDAMTLAGFVLLGAAIGFTGQAGDLLISSLKRRAGAKDAGHIIPGHGGVLDRIDSLLLAAPVFLFAMLRLGHVFGL